MSKRLVPAPIREGSARAADWVQANTQRQLAVAIGVSSTLFLGMTRLVIAHLSNEQADGHVVNVAGRQRMLSQRIAREALAAALGDESAQPRLDDATTEFAAGLGDLLVGAPVRGLPRSSVAAEERLRVVEERWPAFRATAETISRMNPESQGLDSALHALIRHADDVLEDSERVVAHFDDTFSQKVQRLRVRMAILAIGGIGAMGVTYVALLHGAQQRAQRAEAAVRTKERELEELAAERRDLLRRLFAASEDERRRVAADIHDGPTQQLLGAAMLLEAALQDEHTNAAPRISIALEYLESATEETRRIIADLRPPLLDDIGVVEALRRSLEPTARTVGVELTIDGTGLRSRPTGRLETSLYRVAHEAAINALKHSQACEVRVCFANERDGIRLTVVDSGVGFDLATVTSTPGRRPIGLLGMRERVELLGGEFAIEAAAGAGTTMTAWLPNGPAEHIQ